MHTQTKNSFTWDNHRTSLISYGRNTAINSGGQKFNTRKECNSSKKFEGGVNMFFFSIFQECVFFFQMHMAYQSKKKILKKIYPKVTLALGLLSETVCKL